jgi:hypothetical protein
MLRNRLLIVAGGLLLAASAARADGVGYIDCREHPEQTPVFAKARQTHEVVANLPCGERFTILLNGFIFSRIQTADGQVGYVFSNVISVDHSGAIVQRTAPAPVPVSALNPATSAAPVAPATPPSPAQSPSISAQPASTPAPAPMAKIPDTNAAAPVAQNNLLTVPQAQKTATQPAPVPAAEPVTKAAASSVPAVQPNPTAPTPASSTAVQPAAAPESTPSTAEKSLPATSETKAQPTPGVFPLPVTAPTEPTPVPEPSSSAPVTSSPETAIATVAQPNPSAAAEAQPEPAQPVRPIRAVKEQERWEKPNRGTHRAAVLEFFGGYEFARLNNGAGTFTDLNGALGSFGWNVKPWLELVADTSYNFVTVGTTKNVLYGNHWGPRFFYHSRFPWGATPFVEALVGGSRADTTVSGTGGYKTSDIGISYKFGGGLDIRPARYARHFKIRLFDFDYYRTSFGTNLHQNNYSISTGIVLRLFGAGSE